ncbi:MAG TPA: NTP transferase domain-containing protein [Actinomycetales bacterium]|nr:NTP transferase domain-containing protein [Actinomycetales bacterium]
MENQGSTGRTLRQGTSAVLLAAGPDQLSRDLLTSPLGDSTVIQAALATLETVVSRTRITIVVAAGDSDIPALLGNEYTYVEQKDPRGTGHAVAAARSAIPEDTQQLLVAYADTPLLRPESLRGLLNRHRLLKADLSLLTAVIDQPLTYGRIERDDQKRISAILEPSDLSDEERGLHEINVGAYVSQPQALLREIDALAQRGEHRLTEVARRFIAVGSQIASYQIYDTDQVQGINTEQELAVAADIVLRRLFEPRKNTDTHIVFGTGGWRSIIGEGFTLGNVRRLCQAIANEATRKGIDPDGVVIGGDRRFLSREAAEAAAEVFAGNNIPVILLPDDVPTPLVTFAAPHTDSAYSIIVTSSHNPPEWNGMKVFRKDGSLPLDEETDRFQNEANELAAGEVITLDIEKARQAGVVVDQALTDPYIDAIEEIIDVEAVRGSGLEVVVDAMYGTSELTLGTILSDMRVPAEFMHSDHNPLFGGVAPAPDAERMSALIGKIKSGEGRYSLGMATDGDSDRIGIVDELGNYVQTNDLLLLVYWYLHEVRGEVGGVVRNVSTTHMLDRLARHFGEEYRECRVGFKYVTAAMDEIGAILGGESSGGLTVRGWILGKDGIFACALVVEMLARTGKTITELLDHIYGITGQLFTVEDSVPATPDMRVAVPRRLAEAPLEKIGAYRVDRISYEDGTKFYLEDDNWALLRFSGTEPVLRLSAEADSPEKAEELAQWLRGFVTA